MGKLWWGPPTGTTPNPQFFPDPVSLGERGGLGPNWVVCAGWVPKFWPLGSASQGGKKEFQIIQGRKELLPLILVFVVGWASSCLPLLDIAERLLFSFGEDYDYLVYFLLLKWWLGMPVWSLLLLLDVGHSTMMLFCFSVLESPDWLAAFVQFS